MTSEIWRLANNGEPIPIDRALATFADPRNWVQIYDGQTSPAADYNAKPCEWVFIGPVRPPYELAQNALRDLSANATRRGPQGASPKGSSLILPPK